jgi:hypothetical protein
MTRLLRHPVRFSTTDNKETDTMKQLIVTLDGPAESLTIEEVKTLLTEDLGWEVSDVGVEDFTPAQVATT